jgi:glycosyltransferase involved in cell wall biosynthesis
MLKPIDSRPLVSVIVPVFNEKLTVSTVIAALLSKNLPEADLEIIVVESNSTDGTREEVLRFRGHSRLRLLLEDQPRGKGHAVRTGLLEARGDIILIQDADLEYDLDDYSNLLAPILAGAAAFTLGTRHKGALQIRQFEKNKSLALFYNSGHWLLTVLINALYRQKLTDPFTMFKVFRRECIDGMTFECDRFDFDCELVCKLLRAGYQPVEVPVNYRSRSFEQGKKVRTLADPPTWIRSILKCRFQPPKTGTGIAAVPLPRLAPSSGDDDS